MATVTAYLGPNTANAQKPFDGVFKPYVLKNTIDFSLVTLASSDVVQVLNIPAKTLVQNVWVRITTPSGGTLTATVGDTNAANGWDNATDLNAAAGTITCGATGTDAYALSSLGPGKSYPTALPISLTLSANAPGVVGKFDVFALCMDVS